MKTKLDLKRIRELMKKYPLASAAVLGGLSLVLGLQVYQGVTTRRVPGPAAVAPPTAPSPGPSGVPTPGAPGAPGPRGPGPATPAAPGGPGNLPAPTSAPSGIQPPAGRADPFLPLVGEGGGGGKPALPPVPVLGPGGIPLPGVPFPPTGPGGEGGLRVAGIIWNRGAVAIMVDERGSYVVVPGEEIAPGLRVVRIDVGRRIVEVQRSGALEQLTLQGRGGAGL